MKIGILTGGGDCPGLNAVIRAVTRRSMDAYQSEVYGILNGWKGLVNGETKLLTIDDIADILPKGGTILGTSRTNPYKKEEDIKNVRENIKKLKFDAICAIGGEDTLGVANKLAAEGLPCVGVPKTIDNDLGATDFTFGFDTAINIVTEAIDRLRTTTESHHRVMVVEVMGRHAGWIATYSGIAGSADAILIPEKEVSIEEVCEFIKRRDAQGKLSSIIVTAEGAKVKEMKELALKDGKVDSFGHALLGGVGDWIGKEIEKRTGHETRVTILGHIQRGGTPTAFDRVLATRFGVRAADLIHEKKFGYMVALQGNQIVDVSLSEAVKELKTVDMKLFEVSKVFFG